MITASAVGEKGFRMDDNVKAKWSRLAALGLFLAGLAPALMLAAVLIWGLDTEGETVFFLVTMVVAFLASFLVWRFGAWAKILGLVAAAFMIMSLFWTAFGLAQPGSFFDFVPGLLVIPGALIAIIAIIASLIAKRRGHETTVAEGGEKRAIGIVLGVVVLAAAASGALHLLGRSTATATEGEVNVTLRDFAFDQQQYEVPGGVRLFVRNDDPFFHTFTVEELGIDEGFVGASSKIVEIPDRPGTYVVYCKPHTADPEEPSEEDMAARITVT